MPPKPAVVDRFLRRQSAASEWKTRKSELEILLFETLSRLVSNYPRFILGFWFVLLLLCAPFAAQVESVFTSDVGAAPNSQAKQVETLIGENFAIPNGEQLLLVAQAKAKSISEADIARFQQTFSQLLARLSKLEHVGTIRDHEGNSNLPTFTATGRSSLALINLSSEEAGEVDATLTRIEELIPADGPLQYYLSGGPAIDREIQEIGARDTRRAEIYGLPISLLVLVFVFGAVIAAGLPLMVALTSIVLSFAALYGFGQFFGIATFAQSIVTMLGLATGIDYALLMVNRYREELSCSGDARLAAAQTTLSAGKAVTFSGLTVMVALSALLVPPLQFVRSMGIASMIVMLCSVLASVTALPATLALLGERVNWLKLSRRPPGTRSRSYWQQRGEAIMKRPWFWTVFGTLLLLLLSLPALNMQVAFAGVRGLTHETDARKAVGVLEDLGVEGLLRSFDVVIDFGERGFYHPSSVQDIAELTRQSAAINNVEQVYSATTAGNLPALFVSQYYATPETVKGTPLESLARATVSRDGRYALLRVFPVGSVVPAESAAIREALEQRISSLELEALIGGDYVFEQEWAQTLYNSFPLAVGLVYLATFLLLGLAFRSLLIPLKSIILNTLTVGAAFGVITAIFQYGWGAHLLGLPGGLGYIETSVPIFIFAIVFGLSMDYEVFLVSRIVEGHQRGMSDHDAVVHALGTTGGVITSAALIMVIVFSVFIFSGVVLIKTLGLGLSVAVLLDATLVRLALVPSVMVLVGKWNWWLPRRMSRLAERVDIGHD